MKYLPIILLMTFSLGFTGCFDSGSDTTAATRMTIDSGAMTVGASSVEKLSGFNIGEPGQVEVTVTWSTGPEYLTLFMEAPGGATAENSGGSPLVTRMDVTQALLDNSNVISAGVINNDPTDGADIQFTITFTPAG